MRWDHLVTLGLLAFLIWLVSFGLANSATFSFENRGNKTAMYLLYWLDHPFDGSYPANMCGGELPSLEKRDYSYDLPGKMFDVKMGYLRGRLFSQRVFVPDNSHSHMVWDGERINIE